MFAALVPSNGIVVQAMTTSHLVISFAAQEEFAGIPQTLAKTGTINDGVVMDRSAALLAPLLMAHRCNAIVLVFSTQGPRMVDSLKKAGDILGLSKGTCLYQLRHRAASVDILRRVSRPEGVKARSP